MFRPHDKETDGRTLNSSCVLNILDSVRMRRLLQKLDCDKLHTEI